MDFEKFVGFYGQLSPEDWVDIRSFYRQNYSEKTPTKLVVKNEEDINQLKNAIVKNISVNSRFYESKYLKEQLEPLVKFLKEDKFSKSLTVQALFLLHLSKSDSVKSNFVYFFNLFPSFVALDSLDQLLVGLAEFLKKLTCNQEIQNSILDTVRLTGLDRVEYDFSKLSFQFFDSKLMEVYAFAGKNKIYINYLHIKEFMNTIKESNYSDFIDEFTKFELTRIFIHEGAHVVFRSEVNNLNASSPKIGEDYSLQPKCDIKELGQLAEKKVFGGRIDWAKSALSDSFNLAYCREFFEDLLNGKVQNFNKEKAGVVLKKNKGVFMAVDSDIENITQVFE